MARIQLYSSPIYRIQLLCNVCPTVLGFLRGASIVIRSRTGKDCLVFLISVDIGCWLDTF